MDSQKQRQCWPSPLTRHELRQDDSLWSVYETDLMNPNPHFDEGWWDRTKRLRRHRHFTFESEGIEVARVMVKLDSQIFEGYLGLHAGAPAIELVFVEVHSDLRARFSGIGTSVVSSVSDLFHDTVFAKADHGPGGFWKHLGWDEYPRTERPELGWRVFVRPERAI